MCLEPLCVTPRSAIQNIIKNFTSSLHPICKELAALALRQVYIQTFFIKIFFNHLHKSANCKQINHPHTACDLVKYGLL